MEVFNNKQKLVKSKYLHFHQRGNDTLVYHALFGNLTKLNTSGVKFIDLFQEPASLDAVLHAKKRIHGLIHHLKDKFFLVPEKLDERTLISIKLAERKTALESGKLINALQLSVSQACNMKCSYCLTDRVDSGSKERLNLRNPSNRLMSFEIAKKGIETFLLIARRNGRKRFFIKFFGREPLMNWPVMARLLDHFGDGQSYDINLNWDVGTNGLLIDGGIANKLAVHNVRVFVSMDGDADVNDLNRLTAKGKNTHGRIVRSIEMLRKRDIHTTITSVLSANNFHHFDNRLIDFAASRGINTIVLFLAMQNDDIACQKMYTTEEICRKIADIYWYGKNNGIDLRGYWHNPLRRLLTMTSEIFMNNLFCDGDQASCSATGLQVSMEPSGDLFPCRAQSSYLGHIDRIDDMFSSNLYYRQAMRTYMNVDACRDCSLEGLCQGVCLGHCEYKYNDIYKTDDRYCRVYRMLTPMLLTGK